MTDTFWIWFVLAGILLVFEMLSASTFALWIAIGAALTGLISFLFPSLDSSVEIFIFCIFALVGLFIGYKYFRSNKIQATNENLLNQRGSQYIGQIYTLKENIVNGRAHLDISDTLWSIECQDDLETGQRVKVIAVRGNKLQVEKYADSSE